MTSPLYMATFAIRDDVHEALKDCDAVVNFAAETHVDRSINDADAFRFDKRFGHSHASGGREEIWIWRSSCR